VNRSARARTSLIAGAAVALVLSSPASPAFSNHNDRHDDHDDLRKVARGLDGPRGVAALGDGRTLVTENDGTFSLVIERRHRSNRVIELGRISTRFAPAIDVGPRNHVYLLTTGSDVGGKKNAATLFTWRPGWRHPREVADIGRYQRRDKDPYDLERKPKESNPYGVEALDDGTVLVADAAGNDLLRVDRGGDIETVARFKPRKVKVPSGLGSRDPEGRRLPRAGTWVKSESVPTSVVEGDDGHWYVGELRGWPATPGTSQIWRIDPDSKEQVCDPRDPDDRDCSRYADGLTSIVDLAAGEDDTIYALSLSKKSWLRFEMGARGAKVGGLFAVERDDDRRGRDHDRRAWHDDRRDGDDDRRAWHDDRRDGDGRWHDGWDDGWDDDDWNEWRDREADWWDDDHRHARNDERDRRWHDARRDRDDRCDWDRHRDRRHAGDDGRRGGFDDRGDDRVTVVNNVDGRDDERRDGRRGGRDWDDDDWRDRRADDRRRDRDGCRDDDVTIRELARNQLILPGGVDFTDDGDDLYVVAPMFNRGSLYKLDD
jgi:hypothetical protein